MQDGIFHKKVQYFLCKREKTEFPVFLELTFNGTCGMLNMLGRCNHCPIFVYGNGRGRSLSRIFMTLCRR